MFAVLSFTLFTGVANAACGKITVANMNWASAGLMAEVDKAILEKGYGCNVELIPGATMPSFTSMNEKGEPDILPEFWANAALDALTKAEGEGRMHSVNKAPILGLGEGWRRPTGIQRLGQSCRFVNRDSIANCATGRVQRLLMTSGR